MKIYTKKGDNLITETLTKSVYKDDLIIEVSGSLDEVQAHLMVVYNFLSNNEIKQLLIDICKDIFTIGYDISSSKNQLSKGRTSFLESIIDNYEKSLKPLNEFIIPGLTKASSLIHVARTVTRRCERVIVKYARTNKINEEILKYINRLSDLLFVLARYIEKSPS